MQLVSHNRPMAGVWRFLNTEQDHSLGIHLREHFYQSPKVIILDVPLVAIDEHLPQPHAVFLLDAVKFVGLPLLLADFLGR